MQEETIIIENNKSQLILKRSNELLLGAKRIIDKAYENKDIGKMKDIHNQAIVLQDLAKRQRLGIELGNELAEIRLYDEYRMGELIPNIITVGTKSHHATLSDLGLNKSQSSRWQQLPKIPKLEFDEEIKKLKTKNIEITTNHFLTIAKEIDKELERLTRADEGKKIDIKKIGITFKQGDFIKVLNDIPDNSIDLILTDPPYPIEYIEEWNKLANFAKQKLKQHGFCICYSGHKNLPEVIQRMGEKLDYYWIFALKHTGINKVIAFNNIEACWKPILIYQNGFKKIDKK